MRVQTETKQRSVYQVFRSQSNRFLHIAVTDKFGYPELSIKGGRWDKPHEGYIGDLQVLRSKHAQAAAVLASVIEGMGVPQYKGLVTSNHEGNPTIAYFVKCGSMDDAFALARRAQELQPLE